MCIQTWSSHVLTEPQGTKYVIITLSLIDFLSFVPLQKSVWSKLFHTLQSRFYWSRLGLKIDSKGGHEISCANISLTLGLCFRLTLLPHWAKKKGGFMIPKWVEVVEPMPDIDTLTCVLSVVCLKIRFLPSSRWQKVAVMDKCREENAKPRQ